MKDYSNLKIKVTTYRSWRQISVLVVDKMSDMEILKLVNAQWSDVKKVKARFIMEI